MKLLQRVSPVAALALATLITNVTAEDVLISKRQLSKRQLNPEGQYNMCMLSAWARGYVNTDGISILPHQRRSCSSRRILVFRN